MKRTFTIIICILIILTVTLMPATAAGGEGWFIVKKDSSTPGFPQMACYLSEHSCYYVDKECASGEKRIIYLTFDAGYENGNIAKILDILREEDVNGAFFILSNLLCKNEDLVKRMIDEGHLVCNHTSNHKNLTTLTKEEISENLNRLEELCLEKTGYTMPKYFRYPEGYYSKETVDILDNLGYKTFFWSMAYADWDNSRQPSGDVAMNTLLRNTHPGAIVLLHPTSDTNAEILGELIREWKKMGYTFGTLDQLVEG